MLDHHIDHGRCWGDLKSRLSPRIEPKVDESVRDPGSLHSGVLPPLPLYIWYGKPKQFGRLSCAALSLSNSTQSNTCDFCTATANKFLIYTVSCETDIIDQWTSYAQFSTLLDQTLVTHEEQTTRETFTFNQVEKMHNPCLLLLQ